MRTRFPGRQFSKRGLAAASRNAYHDEIGLVAISLSAAGRSEYEKWCVTAGREQRCYRIDAKFVSAGLEGSSAERLQTRKWFDWILIAMATTVFVWTGMVARWPSMDVNWPTVAALIVIALTLFASAALALWKVTRFN